MYQFDSQLHHSTVDDVTPTLTNTLMDGRHTQTNITARLAEVTADWQLSEKVVTVMHNGAANMDECRSRNGWVDVDCSAHKIQLCVTSGMGINKVTNTAISKCLSAASRLMGHFSHRSLASGELDK